MFCDDHVQLRYFRGNKAKKKNIREVKPCVASDADSEKSNDEGEKGENNEEKQHPNDEDW